MKSLLVFSLIVLSGNAFSETKAVEAVVPESAQVTKSHKEAKKKEAAKTAEAPCDTKEDVLKKLEEKKKEQAASGKGFSLQGNTDTGCKIK
jgi:ribosomal protein L13E